MKLLMNELWIFSKDGVPLIEILQNSKVDSSIFGAFISAMGVFSKQMSGASFNGFSLGDNKYIFTSCLNNNILLVCKVDIKVKDKKVQKIFKIIAEFFEEMYSVEDILNFGGDVRLFNKFKEKIITYFKIA